MVYLIEKKLKLKVPVPSIQIQNSIVEAEEQISLINNNKKNN